MIKLIRAVLVTVGMILCSVNFSEFCERRKRLNIKFFDRGDLYGQSLLFPDRQKGGRGNLPDSLNRV